MVSSQGGTSWLDCGQCLAQGEAQVCGSNVSGVVALLPMSVSVAACVSGIQQWCRAREWGAETEPNAGVRETVPAFTMHGLPAATSDLALSALCIQAGIPSRLGFFN